MKQTLLAALYLLSLNAIAASPVWLVQSEAQQLFLAGTVHVLRDSDYPLPAAFDHAYASSQRLVFEIDIDDTQTPEFRRFMTSSVRLPPGTRIEQILNAETMARLKSYMAHNNLSVETFDQLKPAMIATTLTMMELAKMGVSSAGVDAFFHARAHRDNKQILALESAEDQVRLITGMGRNNQDLMIQQTLREIESLASDFTAMLAAWRQGDTALLKSLFVDPIEKEFEPIYHELLVSRNHNWLPRILNHLQTPPTEMVLVGSAHLVGKDGLLQLLKDRGFRITQLD